MSDVAQVSERWTIDEINDGGGTTPRLPYHFSFYTNPDKKITFFRQYSSYFPCQMNWMRNTSRQIVVPMFLHCIYTNCL